MSHLGLLQSGGVLDEEHQAPDQHLGVDGVRLHLESVDQQVDDPGLEVVEVGERNAPVGPGYQLLDGHVGEV